MIYAGTYSTFQASLEWDTSGLVGTLGIRIINATGSTVMARSTSGIAEPVSGSGFYVATVNLTSLPAAPVAGHYYAFWDDGATTPGHVAFEDLMLGNALTLSTALRELSAATVTTGSENINVGFFVA